MNRGACREGGMRAHSEAVRVPGLYRAKAAHAALRRARPRTARGGPGASGDRGTRAGALHTEKAEGCTLRPGIADGAGDRKGRRGAAMEGRSGSGAPPEPERPEAARGAARHGRGDASVRGRVPPMRAAPRSPEACEPLAALPGRRVHPGAAYWLPGPAAERGEPGRQDGGPAGWVGLILG